MTIRFDGEACVRSLLEAAKQVERVADRALESAADHAVLDAKTSPAFQDRTGALRASIRKGVGYASTGSGEGALEVVADGGHALFVEEDTKPHTISAPGTGPGAKGAPYLRFYWAKAGRWVTAKSVNHLGTTGKHFMQTARDAAEEHATREVEIGLSRVLLR